HLSGETHMMPKSKGAESMPHTTTNNETLRPQGLRLTPQRQMILDAIEQANEHLNAESICQRVQARYPFVSLSTVYRTLERLKTLGLVREVHLLGDQRFYESAGGHTPSSALSGLW